MITFLLKIKTYERKKCSLEVLFAMEELPLFNIEIREVYSVNHGVPNTGRHRKNFEEIHDIGRFDPVIFLFLAHLLPA
jgi:hypothetical protein